MEESPNTVHLEKVVDFSKGLQKIQDVSKTSLYNIRDETTGELIENVMRLENTPEYVKDKNVLQAISVAHLGDFFAAITYMSSLLSAVEEKIRYIEEKQSIHEKITRTDHEELEHMEKHVSALETNLRCLRETLTYEENLPPLEECPLGKEQ